LPEQARRLARFDGRTPLRTCCVPAYRHVDKEVAMTDTAPDSSGSDAESPEASEAPDSVQLNADLDSEFAGCGSLDLNAEWVAYLTESAEIPGCVSGVDYSITYEDDGTTAWA
jgi:hypothetical protein